MYPVSRRRIIAISGAAAGLGLLPAGARPGELASAPAPVVWRGMVLGAVGTIELYHPDPALTERLIEHSLAEIRRLEAVFSLYRPDSALSALNRHGVLVAPPADLVRLLEESRRFSELTGGAFDPTVQPLWRLLFEHFSQPGADPAGPPAEAIAAALARIGYRHVLLDRDRVVLAKRGMALTLNGIAQGYITDRILDLLREGGITRTMVDLGEIRVLGTHPDGRPWRVGLDDPDAPGQVREMLDLADRAVATSGGYGLVFDPAGRFNHILDPQVGSSPHLYRSVSVVAPEAATADALSTAFSLMPEAGIADLLGRLPGVEAHLLRADGTSRLLPTA